MSATFYGCELKSRSIDPSDRIGASELLATVLVMKPKPSPYPLIRIGGTGDGAYLVPNDLLNVAACFSPGVNNFKNFEDHLTDQYGIACHMCDKSSDLENFRTPLRAGLQTFRKRWLDVVESDDSISLERWVHELAPGTEDLILQIDIEGAEYRNLLHTPDATLSRFRVIVAEFHGLEKLLDPNIFRNVFRPVFEKLDSMFVCVHAHPNNCCGEFKIPYTELNVPHVHELTFLRRDRIDAAAGREFFAPSLPHPQDIVRNDANKAPIFLSTAWSDGCRATESRIKMLEDELNYLRDRHQREKVNADAAAASMYKIAQRIYREFLANQRQVPPLDTALIDVASGKPFILSSSYGNLAKSGHVAQHDGFFFHTGMLANQSITVDLEDTYCVRRIRISNRSDGFYDRANCLFYVLHEAKDWRECPAYPINVNNEFLTGRSLHCDTKVPSLKGRYVTIFSSSFTALHFSFLQVFGFRIND